MQQKYKVQSGETINDVTVKLYGSIEYLFKLISDNGIGISTDIYGMELIYDNSTILNTPAQIKAQSTIPSIQNSFKGVYGQSIYDAAIQAHGNVEGVIKLMRLNNISLIQRGSVTGKIINYYETDIKNALVYNFMQNLATAGGSEIAQEMSGGSFNNSFDMSYEHSNTTQSKSYNRSFNLSFK